MRRSLLLLLFFVTAPAWAQSRFRIEPPLPDSATAFTISGTVMSTVTCGIDDRVSISGNTIDLAIGHGWTSPAWPPCPTLSLPYPTAISARVGPVAAGVYDVVVRDDTGVIATTQAAVRDAAPPFTVTPNVALAGDQVTLRRSGTTKFCAVPGCGDTRVFFGETEAHIDNLIDDRILVALPPHLPGAVSVIVRTSVSSATASAAFNYLGGPSDAQFFERVLFPVIVSGPGAYGSLWETRVSLRNGAATLTTGGPTIFHNFCVAPCDSRPTPSWRGTVTGVNAPRGFLETIPRSAAGTLSFQERVRDIRSSDAGTSIPIIRENETSSGLVSLLDVPNDGRSRITLRIYSIDGPAEIAVSVAPFALHQRAILDTTLTLTPVDGSADLAEASLDITAQPESLAIFCAPRGPQRIWAFVSITNNETQHVTVVSPE